MKRLSRAVLVTVVAVLFNSVLSARAHADGSLNFSSSVTAKCVGGVAGDSCDEVLFTLNVSGPEDPIFVDTWSVFADGSVWSFDDVVSLTDANDNDLLAAGWSSGATTSGIEVFNQSGGDRRSEPLKLTVAMASFGSSQQLTLMDYSGQGNTQSDGTGTLVSFSGTVTPEPMSVVLLGTGLLGLGLAARVRGRKDAWRSKQ